jgi:hypothetical protein
MTFGQSIQYESCSKYTNQSLEKIHIFLRSLTIFTDLRPFLRFWEKSKTKT